MLHDADGMPCEKSWPSFHGCGSIKGNRENFPKRKEKKRKREKG